MVTISESLVALRARIESLERMTDLGSKFAVRRQKQKLEIWLKQDGICCFCDIVTFPDSKFGGPPKARIATLEHVICRTHGGNDSNDNLKISCYRCNMIRGTSDYSKFSAKVKDDPNYLYRRMGTADSPKLPFHLRSQRRLWAEAYNSLYSETKVYTDLYGNPSDIYKMAG